ncbi:MAG: hypothetical protein HP497_10600 [Nitrospira sp.]|nr:hypothetical protein [Nitrospira sp.]
MSRIVRPDADKLFVGNVGGNGHFLIRRRPGGVRILSHRQTGIRFLRRRVHKQHVAAQKRDNDVVLCRVEEDHVRTADGFLRCVFAEFADLSGQIDGLGRLGRSRIRRKLCPVENVQIATAFLPCVRLVSHPNLIGLRVWRRPYQCSQHRRETDRMSIGNGGSEMSHVGLQNG